MSPPPRDHQALNLVGALEDLHDLGLAHVSLDAIVAGVPGAAEHLHGVGGHFHRCVGGDQLGDAGLRRILKAEIASARGIEVGCPCADDRGAHISQQEAEPLVVDDLAAERRSFVRIPHCLVQRGLRQSGGHCGDAQPAGVQCAESDLQPLPVGTDAAVRRDACVVVERRSGRDRMQAHLLLGLAEAESGQIAGNQETAYAP